MRHRWAAVACDGGLVVAIALCVFIACDKFWLPLGVAMLAYYLGGILLLGNTPGVCLFAPGEAGGAHYNHPSDEPQPGARHRASVLAFPHACSVTKSATTAATSATRS